jgi:hypothetical protein
MGVDAPNAVAGDPQAVARRAVFCVVRGPTRGRACAPAGIRAQLHNAAASAGLGDGSRRTSYGTLMPSRCHVRESR